MSNDNSASNNPNGTLVFLTPALINNISLLQTTTEYNAAAQARWRSTFQRWDGQTIELVKPTKLYPPFDSFLQMVQAVQWQKWDRDFNRYGETNVIQARNQANVRTQAIVDQLMQQLEQLFANGRFGGQNRNWLQRGLQAAGALGMAGAVGGPYVAVATALAGFVASACQDLWPTKKQELLDTWRGILRDCNQLERYLLVPYMREIAVMCFRLEPGYSSPDQPPTDPWRWGTQPQPFGHNIVTAGALGICTFLGEILLEFDSFPEAESVQPTADDQTSAVRAFVARSVDPRAPMTLKQSLVHQFFASRIPCPDPLYCTYIAALICGDHPPNFYLRDAIHRNSIYSNVNDARGARWIKQRIWPLIKDRKVGDLKAEAVAAGIPGMSPTFYTRSIDRALVNQELPR